MKSTMVVGGSDYGSQVPWSLEDCAIFCGRLLLLPLLVCGLLVWTAVVATASLVQTVVELGRGAKRALRAVSRSTVRQAASGPASSAGGSGWGG